MQNDLEKFLAAASKKDFRIDFKLETSEVQPVTAPVVTPEPIVAPVVVPEPVVVVPELTPEEPAV